MYQIIVFLKKKNKKLSFYAERIICRLLSSWCAFSAWGLIKEGDFDRLSYRQGLSPAWILLCIALLFIAYSVVHILLSPYESDSWFLMAGATVCVVRWLTASSEFLFSLSVILAYSLFVLYFIWKNEALWQKWNPGKRTVWCTALLFGLACGAVIGTVTCLRYLTFSSPNFDFGIFVNMLYHMKEDGLPLCTCERDVMMSHFAVHFSPIWYVLLPFYALFPSPLTLQIGQAVAVASGVIPVVLLCRSRKLSGKSTIWAAMIYCFYPALTTGCFFDIHENCFLTPLLLWMFYFFERERYVPMYVFAALTLSVKEDAAVYVFFFALYVLFAGKKRKHGIFLAVCSLAYFSAAFSFLQKNAAYYAELYATGSPNPSINGPMINRYDNFIYTDGDGLVGALGTVFVNPGYFLKQIFTTGAKDWGKFVYFLKMLLPVGLIPFLSKKPSRWLLIAPVLMNLATNYTYQYDLGYQYHFGISAFLIYGAILNLSDMPSSLRRASVGIAVTACCCLYLTSVYPKVQTNYRNWKENREKYIRMEEILETVPRDASVCCSTFLLPHLANRDEVYEIYYHGGEGDVDYVIFDARYTVEKRDINVFLRKGYVIREEYEGLLIILAKEQNP